MLQSTGFDPLGYVTAQSGRGRFQSEQRLTSFSVFCLIKEKQTNITTIPASGDILLSTRKWTLLLENINSGVV